MRASKWILVGTVSAGPALAGPQTLTTSGRLLDADGAAISGLRTLRFDLVDGSGSVWHEEHAVVVEGGYYAVVLGTSTPLGPALLADDLSLTVSVGGEALSSQPLAAAPYALAVDGLVRVGAVDRACTGALAGTLRVQGGALSMCNGTAWQALAALVAQDGTQARPGTSCRQILEDGHSVGDGKYWLRDNLGAAFPAYCDMANGGWTLMAVDRVGGFSRTSAFWDGALGSSTAFTWGGESFTTGNLEAVIRSVPFTELRLGTPTSNWWVASFADGATSFKAKKARETPALFNEAAPFGCGWNKTYTGTHTTGQILFGCELLTGYGDHDLEGLGGRADQSSGGASCDVSCGAWHTFGRPGHRAFSFLTAGNSGAWVR